MANRLTATMKNQLLVFVCCSVFLTFLGSLGWGAPGVKLSIESPRRAFYRGEEIRLLVKCANTGDEAVGTPTLSTDLGGLVKASSRIADISKGGEALASFRLPTTAVKSGEYRLTLTLAGGNGVLASETAPITIGRTPNPEALMVWLWGGLGDQWYIEHGFTSWTGPYWSQATAGGKDIGPDMDKALPFGAGVGLRPNGGLSDIDVSAATDPDRKYEGLYRPANVANPFNPENARIQDEANRKLMETVKDYPQIKTAHFNSEIVDNLAQNTNKAGVQMMKDALGFTEREIGPPKYVATGVLADDDRRYVAFKYAFETGKGLALANKRTADMVHRYRPDILTFNDPYREASLLDCFPGIDVVETWTYSNPDPKLMFYAETLRAATKPTGQLWCNTVTLLNYPGELDPTDAWMLMDSGRATVTSWINLSRAPKIVGYYYGIPDAQKDAYQTPHATSLVIKALADNVYRPYGPMITNLQVEPRRIAVLSSAAARMYGKSPNLIGYYDNIQIYSFYSLLAMAHLQADVVFDQSIERFGLDDYDVLVLAKCDVLTKSVYDKVIAFQKRGGILIADQYLGPEIPGVIKFDFDFTYRDKVSANALAKNQAYANWNDHLQPGSAELKTVTGVTALDDQKFMESYAAHLKDGLKGKVEPDVDCDSPTVLFNMLEKNGVKYLVVINDKRTYDDRVGKYKSVLGKMLPQTATIRLKKWGYPTLYAYDMLDRKPLALKKTGSGYEFTLNLTELGGKLVALYPTRIGRVSVSAPKTALAGIPCNIGISMDDAQGDPLPGLQPVQVTITDPKGARSEFSDYYCAKNGVLSLPFTAALNDLPGKWKVTVLDLTSGLRAEKVFALAK